MTGRLVSFDPLRTLNIPGVIPLKPEHWLSRQDIVQAADWILFPEYWQVNALVYGWKKKIFPSISSFHLGHDKVEMTRVFQAVCPENTPFTQILAHTETAIEQVLDGFCFPFVAKEVRNSMGQGVFLIETRKDFLDYARRQFRSVCSGISAHQPGSAAGSRGEQGGGGLLANSGARTVSQQRVPRGLSKL